MMDDKRPPGLPLAEGSQAGTDKLDGESAPSIVPQIPLFKFGSHEMSGALMDEVVANMKGLENLAALFGGPGAFVMTKTGAAWHEAGHAVVSATLGVIPTSVRIWNTEGDWAGHTAGTPGGLMNADSAPESDRELAVLTFSGALSEMLFDPDFRHGSSLFERGYTSVLADVIAVKTGADRLAVFREIRLTTEWRLKSHEPIVRLIAGRLLRKRRINAPMLRKLLAPISGAVTSLSCEEPA